MDRIAAMNAFVRVVEAGNFTKAAESLSLPNASVTRQIQSLEQDLKVLLLHRTTRAVTVTAEGATYYERVVRLLSDLADIESSTRQSSAKPVGTVRVDVPAAIATMVLVPALGDFRRAYPDVKIELGGGQPPHGPGRGRCRLRDPRGGGQRAVPRREAHRRLPLRHLRDAGLPR